MISKLENYYRKAIFLFKFLTNSSKLNEKIFDNIQYKNLVSVNSNLLLKLIFPREFSSQKKKKKNSGIEGKQVFQEDRFQSFQTVRLGRSNSSNRYRTPPDIARSILIQWTAHAILNRSVPLLALSTFYLQLRVGTFALPL